MLEEQAELVREEIDLLLASLPNDVAFCDLVKEPLIRLRCVCDRPWSLLPLIVCEAISGHYEHVLPAAAALELLSAAAEVFDDIEDADSSESLSAKYGGAVATNIATALLILAGKEITRLQKTGVADAIVIRVMDAVNSFHITACAGQHLDLSITSETTPTEEVCLRIAGMKGASTTECACHIGALLALADQELIDRFALFGYNLGMASQIANDIQGIMYGHDIAKHKITLPLTYAFNQTDDKALNKLKLAFNKPCESVPDPTEIKDLLFSIGAIHYTTIIMDFYKQRASDILSTIEKSGLNIERLKLFLE